MSLILEALRKSEAERQRGRAPGLFVEQAAKPSQQRGVPGWAWGLGTLLLLVLLAWGWREWERAGLANTVPVSPASMDAAPASVSTSTALSVDAAPAMPAPVPAAPAPIAPTPVPAPAPTAPPPRSEPVATAPPPVNTAPPPAAPEAIGAATPAPVAEPQPFVPSLSSLAASERTQLPPLKLSMHVFAATPAQRFVILDGRRLGEGASPAAGLVVEEIRRDGLVLSVNGQRFLLARP